MLLLRVTFPDASATRQVTSPTRQIIFPNGTLYNEVLLIFIIGAVSDAIVAPLLWYTFPVTAKHSRALLIWFHAFIRCINTIFHPIEPFFSSIAHLSIGARQPATRT
jgi:hypothetical protein